MSLIATARDLSKLTSRIQTEAEIQQKKFFQVIDGIVKLRQKLRHDGYYEISDQIRDVLKEAKIEIRAGTEGRGYGQIPNELKSRPIGDEWIIK